MKVLSWYHWFPIPANGTSLAIAGLVCILYLSVLQYCRNRKLFSHNALDVSLEKKKIFERLFGFLFFGPLALLLYYFMRGKFCTCSLGMNVHYSQGVAVLTAFLLAIVLIVSWLYARSRFNNNTVVRCTGTKWKFISYLILATYAISIEFLFRGMLWHTWLNNGEASVALLVNMVVFALFYLPKGLRYAIASVPFSFALCILSLISHSFWPCAIVHIVLVISYEWFTIIFKREKVKLNEEEL
jgi:membrane protease YdiL (CAAX protease family)